MYQIRTVAFPPLPEVVPGKRGAEHEFDLGDLVQWSSCGTTKFGEVVAIVPPGEFPPVLEQMPGYSFKANGCACMARKKVSYFVAVTVPRSKIRRLYWPCSKLLRKIDGTQ